MKQRVSVRKTSVTIWCLIEKIVEGLPDSPGMVTKLGVRVRGCEAVLVQHRDLF